MKLVMKTKLLLGAPLLAAALCLTGQAYAGGIWIQMTNTPGGTYFGHMHLLTDGTVMSENGSSDYTIGPTWSRLTPDIHGSYVHGTWSTTASMNYTHEDFASQVLPNGKLMVAGGEYGTGGSISELYDPQANTWTVVPVPAGYLQNGTTSTSPPQNLGFSDAESILLPNGNMLVAPVAPVTSFMTMIYSPGANSWSAGPSTIWSQDEAAWVKLPDNSILTVDKGGLTAERYIPSENTWVPDLQPPVQLYDSIGSELGPAFLLPNGKAIFFGSTGATAIYTPSGSPALLGSWVAGPTFPNGQGMPDAPAAMLPNGNILCATATAPGNGTTFYTPVSFYEYSYLDNNFTQVAAPTNGTTFPGPCWPTLMLDLPDGTVLFASRDTSLYIYQPTNIVPLAAAQPTVLSVTKNSDGSLHLTGTVFNGISSGAAYGDDEQVNTDYPLVRFTDGGGNVRYGRTYNWNVGVATGNKEVSTDCALPAGASLQDTIHVVANGIASAGVHFPLYSGDTVWVDYSYNGLFQLGIPGEPFNTIHTGVQDVPQGGNIIIAGGHLTSGGDGIINISKPVRITAWSGTGTASIGPN
jgi:hypothetical protein